MNKPSRPFITRRGFLAGSAAVLAAAGARTTAAQTPPTSFPPFPELRPLPEIAERSDGPLNVVATTGIVGDLVAQIGGGRVSVRTILPANADPHTYEPAPQDIAIVDDAEIVFMHGLDLDAWVETIIENADGDFVVITVTDGVETVERGEDGDDHGDDDHHDVDPHVWFDPTRTSQMVANIAAALSEADPEGADGYASRLNAYQGELAALDMQITERIALVPEDLRRIVTNHDSLGYYADRYGLTIVGTVIPGLSANVEPSAQEIAELLEVIESEGVTAIFAENTVDPVLAQQLAEESGIQVVDTLYTDSLGEPGSGADTYIGLMRFNTGAIVTALLGS